MSLQVHCSIHGDHPAAYVCTHLLGDGTTGVVVGGDLDAAAAICMACDEGTGHDWNALDPGQMDVVCILCFGDAVASAQDLSGLPEPQELFTTACQEMIERNRRFLDAIDHDARSGWQFTETRALEFLDADAKPVVRCACDSVGSLDPTDGTWKWAWANDTVPAGIRGRAAVARSLGDRLGLPVLRVPDVPNVAMDAAWHLAQLGAWLVGAKAAYQLEYGELQAFVAVADWSDV